MTRTTETDVRAILPAETQLTAAQINAAIAAATCMVDQITVYGDCASHLSDDCLLQVETYLAAHVAACTENTLSIASEKDGCCGSSVTYGFKFGEGVKGTPFGMTANMLSGGCLAQLDKAPVGFYSIGSI